MFENKNYQKSIEELTQIFEDLESERDLAIEKVKNFDKDERIQEVLKENETLKSELNKGFCFSEKQWKEIKEWEEKHIKTKHQEEMTGKIKKCSGVHFDYSFSYTPVGTLSSVVCEECRKKAFEKAKGNRDTYNKYMEENNAIIYPGEV